MATAAWSLPIICSSEWSFSVDILALASLLPRSGGCGIGARHLLAAGFGLNILMLALIVTQALSSTYVAWALYGLGSAVNVLGFTVLGEGFPPELAARANTALNLLMFTASFFATQWGIGVVVDVAQAALGIDVAGALRLAFALVFAADVLALAWFALGWRRYAVAAPPARVVA